MSAGTSGTETWRAIADRHGEILVRLAAASILHGLDAERPLPVRPDDFPADLRIPGAAFVTLTADGELRGCIGSVVAWRPLLLDVAENAFKAAFGDPRFPPLDRDEIGPGLDLSVSLLTPPVAFPVEGEADARARVRPGIDGLVMEDLGRRGLFLPQVWEQLPDPAAFLTHLKRKAGLPPDHWSPTLRLSRFESVSIKTDVLADPSSLWRGVEV